MTKLFGKRDGSLGLSVARWALGLVTGLALAVGASAAAPPLNTVAFSTNIYVAYDTFEGDYYVTNLYGGGAAPVSVDYTVDVANPTNTAVYGVDYILNPGTITFQAGVFGTNFTVQILPTATAGRTLCLRLSNPTAPAVLDSALSQAELRIMSEPLPKVAAGEFSFSRFEYMITDQEGPDMPVLYPQWGRSIPGAVITINRTNGSMGRVSVDFSATSLDDPLYLETGRVFFDDGQTSTNFVLSWPIWNLVYPVTCPYALPAGAEGPLAADMFVNLQLSNPLPDPMEDPEIIQPALGGRTQADLLMVGTGQVLKQASLTSLHCRVDEYGNRLAHVTVYLHGGGWNPAPSVDLYIKNFPGYLPLDESSDYALAPLDASLTGLNSGFTRYTFPPGVTAVTHAIPVVIPDTLVEFNEDLRLTLQMPPPGVVAVDSINPEAGHPTGVQGVLTVLFNDQPPGAADREWAPTDSPNTVPPFNTSPGANNRVQSVAVQPDGKTVLGGDFTGVQSVVRNHLARLNTDGSLDTNFLASPNTGANGPVSQVLVISPDGVSLAGLLIAGTFTSYNEVPCGSLARLLPDGSLDPSFNVGTGANGPILAMAVQPDGKIIIGGDFTQFNGTERQRVARLEANGSLDTSFVPGSGADNVVLALALDSFNPGKVYLAGRFTHCGGLLRQHIARIDADGALDPAFNPGAGADGLVHTLACQPDGKILLGGEFSAFNTQPAGKIARANPDGSADASFNPGQGADDAVYSIVPHPDGRIYIGGHFSSYNGTRRLGLALLRTDGSLDTRFMDTAYNQFAGLSRKFSFETNHFISAIALQADGNLIVGGSFSNLGGNQCQFYNDLHTDVGAGSTYPPTYPGNPPWCSVWTRQDKVARHNIARLIGTWGATTNSGVITQNPEQGPGNIEFAYSDYSADESQGILQAGMIRADGLLGTATVLASTKDGTATAGSDFVSRTNVLASFLENGSGPMLSDGFPGPVYFEVPILGDSLVEGNEVLDLSLYAPQGSITLGGEVIPLGPALGRRSAPLTIVDDDYYKGTFVFASPTYTIKENSNGTNVLLTVLRTNGFLDAVSVTCYTINGEAQAGRDFVAVTNVLLFDSGETLKTVSIPILNESIIETNAKTFLVVLTNATGGATLPGGLPTSFASTQVTIEDNDFTLSHLGFNSTNFLVRLSVNTEPNSRYTFETSTNLLNWKTNWIFTAVDFTTIFNYPETSHPPMKFYRVRYLSGP